MIVCPDPTLPIGMSSGIAGVGSGCAAQAGAQSWSVPPTILTPTGSRSLRFTPVTAIAVGSVMVTVYRTKSPLWTTGTSAAIVTCRTSPRKTGTVVVGSSSPGFAGSLPVSRPSLRPGSSEIWLIGPAAVREAWLVITVPPGVVAFTVTR